MKKLILLFSLLLFVGHAAHAQEKSSRELKADHHFTVYAYDKAIIDYNGTNELTTDGLRKLAISYHKLDQNDKAEEAYVKLMAIPNAVTAEDLFNYAMVLKANGKYTEANQQLDKFAAKAPNDLRAKSYLNTSASINELMQENGRYTITNLDINTSADDYAPNYFKNSLVFASNRATPKFIVKKYNWTGKPFTDIYSAEISGDQLKKPGKFDKKLNGVLHDGPVSFDKDYTMVAYTKNNINAKKKDDVVSIQIYFSYFIDGRWSDPRAFPLNNPDYSVGHPYLTADGQTLYFTSDMPGGYGEADIYSISKEGDGWGKPKNLGSTVNTESDEMFPFYDEKNDLLYFSSNGHCGLGGLDIFICQNTGETYSKAYNLGYPLNTQYDDFAAIAQHSMRTGYFSSNRPKGQGGDDLYSFEVLKGLPIGKRLIGIVKDDQNSAINGAMVSLSSEGSNVLDSVSSDKNGGFVFMVDGNKNYTLTGKKTNYTNGKATANTFGKELSFKVELTMINTDTVIIIENKLSTFNPIYFDLNKYDIRSDASIILDKIIVYLNDHPQMSIELNSFTDCRESKHYNQVLSNQRAKSAANYIRRKISNPKRLTSKGNGENLLVNDCTCEGEVHSNCSESEHQKNRRTEFNIIPN